MLTTADSLHFLHASSAVVQDTIDRMEFSSSFGSQALPESPVLPPRQTEVVWVGCGYAGQSHVTLNLTYTYAQYVLS